jgi:hypothetical protein
MSKLIFEGLDYSHVTVDVQIVTPVWAEDALTHIAGNQRNPILSAIDRYSRDIELGKFRLQESCIAFGDDGALINGQQRLRAVVKSGRPIISIVLRNVPVVCSRSWDVGSKRTLLQALFVHGIADLSKSTAALINATRRGASSAYGAKVATTEEAIAFIEKHREPLVWIQGHFRAAKKIVTRTGVQAVLLRAWYSEALEQLERFIAVFKGLPCEPEESAAAALYRALCDVNKRDIGSTYCIAQSALSSFLKSQPRQFIRPVLGRDLWELPE